MRKYNICTCKVYQSQDQEKKYWPNVGTLTFFDARADQPEGYKLELNMFPNEKFYVFEQKDHQSGEAVIDADSREKVTPERKPSTKKTHPQVSGGIEY